MSKQVQINRVGDSDVLEIVDVDVPAPSANEVQIAFQVLGLNRAEIMYRRGRYIYAPQFPSKLGYEGAGVVRAVGASVQGIHVGDAVSVIPSFLLTQYDTYAEVANLPAHAVVKHPKNLSFEEAAASWMAFITVYGAFVELYQVKAGDFVVLGAATSSVGLAAIQFAKMLGATAIALTRSHAKGDILVEKGADFVLATQEDDLSARLKEITNGRGVNLVFDPVGGPVANTLVKAMAQNGYYIVYGALSHDDIAVPVFDILGKHLTLRGYELFELTTNPKRLEKAKAYVYEALASHKLRPEIDRVFDFKDIAKAHDYMEEGTQIGKVLVRV
ncbi:zinc-dependent alcohol dehydrogenase family protein [Helicobacter ailurogastricus]|uniref:zinc-dependent alcohol dehydrogenase family protein n=1 Tax=Helicobacter ailurogastricus TaxID=1578720 RepID=UPI00244D95A4|nr:zinc-dependent alcohol dehydrogenase family protein [Helicobacter ailurogastricus]GMB91003.1 zinc-dependent alcohol dehydrogenase family protein [Helicobacter ailurogastricus]